MNEKEFFKQLKEDMEQLDELSGHSTPSVHTLKEQLIVAQMEKRRAFRKELIVFVLTALFILTAFTVVVFKAPIIFVVIQIAALVGAPVLFFFLRKRQSEGRPLS
ncbi:YxlC family protein [Robertmurraya massiliosenegalensis]|uniref:YxlC family protein n=1 Tax=Robertmurraya massiliosenegalensis TaxID=1287657 RepID=UPI0003115B70|nr:YxlC family protein [Robertmurraya massiliosenegalensis]